MAYTKVNAVPSHIKFKRVKIDPALAEKWLDTRHLNNRYTRKAKIRNYANDMLAGLWYENGDMIRLAVDGELLDGMHRLLAIIKANIEITLWVAFDVPKPAMETIDIGAVRSLNDHLKMGGEHNNVVQAGITRRYYAWTKGFRIYAGGSPYPSLLMLRNFYAEHRDDIRFAAKIGEDIRRKTQFLKVTYAGMFFLITADIDHDEAIEFKDRVLDGEGLSQNHPIAALRRRLLGYGAKDLTDWERLAMFINAWNLWRDEQTAETIYKVYGESGKGSNTQLTSDNFPEPH
jgi:hypothetical protein